MDCRWDSAERAPDSHFARFGDYSKATAQLFHNRGIHDPDAAALFLACRATHTNPFLIHGMQAAVERIRRAIAQDEKIIVHGDFDADGVTATAILVEGLNRLGARVAPYIPHRVDEGYGLNQEAIGKMHAAGVTLMVTVDCGIRAGEEIGYANQLGVDVVVTDHHSPPVELPPAIAIVNPHQPACSYPHKMLSGAGLSYKTVQALWLAERKSPIGRGPPPGDPAELLGFVALGTIADVVPLTGENRQLVARGLEQLSRTPPPGLKALMEQAGVRAGKVDSEAVAFYLGPRINAAGRLAHAVEAYRLLRAPAGDEALRLAEALNSYNRQRQEETRQALARAERQLGDPTAPLLFVVDDQTSEGIVGLVAGRLKEMHYRPTIVVQRGPHESRASCRSIPELHITRVLEEVAPLLERYGGHGMAAGFTVRSERLPELEQRLTTLITDALGGPARVAALQKSIRLDGDLALETISDRLLGELNAFRPFGTGNEEPLWRARNVEVRGVRAVGKQQAHLKFDLVDGRRRHWSAISFRTGARQHEVPAGSRIDVAFHLRENVWKEQVTQELHIIDFQPVAALEARPA